MPLYTIMFYGCVGIPFALTGRAQHAWAHPFGGALSGE